MIGLSHKQCEYLEETLKKFIIQAQGNHAEAIDLMIAQEVVTTLSELFYVSFLDGQLLERSKNAIHGPLDLIEKLQELKGLPGVDIQIVDETEITPSPNKKKVIN